MDIFEFNDMLSLGELCKVRVWHDNKGKTNASGWIKGDVRNLVYLAGMWETCSQLCHCLIV